MDALALPGAPAVPKVLFRSPFGWHLSADLHGCKPEAIADPVRVISFSENLTDLIGMRRFGQPWVERFGQPGTQAYGLTLVQLIETSSVMAHFSEELRSAYIDVFSCKRFDPDAVTTFAVDYFAAVSYRSTFVKRD